MEANGSQKTGLGQRRQQQILRAAENEFEQYGFNGARMQRIADRAGVPKSNVHYYFANKSELYDAVLVNVVALWDQALAPIDPDSNPTEVLLEYVRLKVEFTHRYPAATRIFALELLHGGDKMSKRLNRRTCQWTHERAAEIQRWIDRKQILPLNPYHLIFMIWASTQHYAQSETQVRAIYRKRSLTARDHQQWAQSLQVMVLRICGLENPD
ncbi:MAG: TetR/AcrR family transcriptional regulator [Pseudomonadota bacterium]